MGIDGKVSALVVAGLLAGATPALAADTGPFTSYMDVQTARVLPPGRTALAFGGGTFLGFHPLGAQAAFGLFGDAELLVNGVATYNPPTWNRPTALTAFGGGVGLKQQLRRSAGGSLAAVVHVLYQQGFQFNYQLYAALPHTLAWGPGELTVAPYLMLPDLASQSVNVGFANAGTVGVQAGYLRPLGTQLHWISEGALAYHTSRFPAATLRTGLRYAPVANFCLDGSAGLNLGGPYPALAENNSLASLTARMAF